MSPLALSVGGRGLNVNESKDELARQLFAVALVLVETGRLDIAESTYKLALELDPNDFRSVTNLAVIVDKSGRHLEAEELYLKAANLPFFDPVAMFNLGYLYSRTDRAILAETWYRRALVADPNYSEAMVNLAGLVQVLRQDLSEAKRLLEEALRIDPRDSIAIQDLANIYRLNGENFLAEMLYWQAVETAPNSALANFNLASYLGEIDRQQESQYFFDLAYQIDTNGNLKRGTV